MLFRVPVGGPEKTILNSPRFIKEHGYQTQVVYLCPPDPVIQESLRSRASNLDGPLTIVEDHGVKDFCVVGKTLKICRDQKIELLQTHYYKSNALGLLLRRLHKMHMKTYSRSLSIQQAKKELSVDSNAGPLIGMVCRLLIERVAYENTRDVWIPLKFVNFVDTSLQRIR